MHRKILVAVSAAITCAFALQATATSASEVRTPPAKPSAAAVLGDINAALSAEGASPATMSIASVATPTSLPSTGSQVAEIAGPVGHLAMRVPATGRDQAPRVKAVAILEGAQTDTTLVVQSAADGLRALVHIDSANAPERFAFSIGGDVASLGYSPDGGVIAFNSAAQIVATAPAPWAIDATGKPVPTRYEIDGTTLTQVVNHRAGTYVYGIVADPWWNPFSWNWGKIFRKASSVVANTLRRCGEGALVSTFGLAIATGTTNVLITKYSSTLARVKVGGVYGYVGIAAAGCIMNNLS